MRAGGEHLDEVALDHHQHAGGVAVVVQCPRAVPVSTPPPTLPRGRTRPGAPAGGLRVVVGVGPPQVLAGGQAGGDVGEELAAEGGRPGDGGSRQVGDRDQRSCPRSSRGVETGGRRVVSDPDSGGGEERASVSR